MKFYIPLGSHGNNKQLFRFWLWLHINLKLACSLLSGLCAPLTMTVQLESQCMQTYDNLLQNRRPP